MNERTYFFIKNIHLTLYFRKGDVSCVWEVSWRRGQTATYWPKVLLAIAALLLHSGWAAQRWVTEGRKSSLCKLILTLASCPPTDSNSNWNSNWPKQSVTPGYIFVCRPPASCGFTHLPPSPNSTTSTVQGDIPISSTGSTCFTVLPPIYTGASLDWRLFRGSICYTQTLAL